MMTQKQIIEQAVDTQSEIYEKLGNAIADSLFLDGHSEEFVEEFVRGTLISVAVTMLAITTTIRMDTTEEFQSILMSSIVETINQKFWNIGIEDHIPGFEVVDRDEE